MRAHCADSKLGAILAPGLSAAPDFPTRNRGGTMERVSCHDALLYDGSCCWYTYCIYSLHQDNRTNQWFNWHYFGYNHNNSECFVAVLSSCRASLHVVNTPSGRGRLQQQKRILPRDEHAWSMLFEMVWPARCLDRRNIGRIDMAHILPLCYPRNISQSDGGFKYRPNRVDLGACDT
jgi:hypothetical protein